MELRSLIIKRKEEEVEMNPHIEIPEEKLCRLKLKDHYNLEINDEHVYMAKRGNGEFMNKAIFLSPNFDWVLGKDKAGDICLVPLRKG